MEDGSSLVIEARGLVYRYAEHRPALAGIDLEVGAGEAAAVVGPSGSGKSTLLHCCAGLERPDEGALVVCGTDVVAATDAQRRVLRRRDLGLVYQDGQLLPELDVLANVALPARLRGSSRASARAAATASLAALGLDELAGRSTAQLSGGQLQRVAVARALVHEPRLVLADEPTGALDSANRTAVVDLLLSAVQETGAALVMVTHDAALAQRCDRVVEMVDGRTRS